MKQILLATALTVGLFSASHAQTATQFFITGLDSDGRHTVLFSTDDYDEALSEKAKLVHGGMYTNVTFDMKISPIVPKRDIKGLSQATNSAQSQSSSESVDLSEYYAQRLPNDPFVLRQQYLRTYRLHHIVEKGTYYGDFRGIGAVEAWALDEKANTKMRVMVIDGGFYPNDDLVYDEGVNFIDPNADNASPPNVNFSNGDYLLTDIRKCLGEIDNHGTQMSGLIAATRDNNVGVAGVAENVELVAVNALQCGTGFLSNIIRGVLYGAQIRDSGIITADIPEISKPVDIINLSFAGRIPQCPAQLQAAINEATDKGILIVASAGNASENASDYYPANCDNVITVGGTNMLNEALWSNTNTGKVDIYAPAVTPALLSGPLNNDISTAEGTSNSAPLVSGTLAMVKRNAPAADFEEIAFLVRNTGHIMSDANPTLNAPSLMANAIARDASDSAGLISHALQENTQCDIQMLVSAFGARSQMCSLVKIPFLLDTPPHSQREFVLVEVRNNQETEVLRSTQPVTYAPMSMISDGSTYTFDVCIDGKCQRSPRDFILDVNTPSACTN